jgi:CRISPR/Cas system-associated exonuclease Cas4 (RecB family)
MKCVIHVIKEGLEEVLRHISFSQYSSYLQCPRSWYLGRVVGAPSRSAWYTIVGSAVHQATEAHLNGGGPDVKEIFYQLVREARKVEPDTDKWLAGGPKGQPVTKELALRLALDCYDKALEFLGDIDVWAVEYDASGTLPGLEVPIKAYVDIIGEHKKHGPVIIDLKTGRSKPKDNFQLETYRALLDIGEGWELSLPSVGMWAMLAPQASEARPVDLSKVDPAEVGAKYQSVYERMKDKVYKTNAGFNCNFCFVQDNCLLRSGPTDQARYYDKSDDDGFPF